MRQNLANRLAGGGFWALRSGVLALDSMRHMREQGTVHPAVQNLTDRQVLGYSTVTAFNLFVNVNLEPGSLITTQTTFAADEPGLKYADKYGAPITHEHWLALHRNDAYRQIDLWRNGLEAVYTLWTGVDTNGCNPPHLFVTAVVRYDDGQPIVQKTFKTTCFADARQAHRQVIDLVRRGIT